jgi:hypothetical protein
MVRDVGRNVVIRLTAEEANTARNSSRFHGLPITGSANAPKTLSEISSLPRPSPSVPTPAYIWVAVATIRYVSRIDNTVSSAARPGVLSASLDSSLTVRQVSQPQNAKIDPESPAMNADRVNPDGLNQSKLKGTPVSDEPDLAKARTAKTSRITIWNPTRTN